MSIARSGLMRVWMTGVAVAAITIFAGAGRAQNAGGFVPADYQRMRSVAQAAISPDGKFVGVHGVAVRPAGAAVAAVVGARYGEREVFADRRRAGRCRDRRCGRRIRDGSLTTARRRESTASRSCIRTDRRDIFERSERDERAVAGTGAEVTWSPDSKQIAFISATPGPETADATAIR